MPILVGDHHFLDNLLEIFVGCFDCPIHLWSIRGRIEVFNLPFGAQFVNQLPIEILSIISYGLPTLLANHNDRPNSFQ
jgi:hypothetical protein